MHFPYQALTLFAASLLLSTASAAATCNVGSAWPDKHDCHSFFECGAGGIPVRKTCGPGTAYSPKIGVCDYEYKVPSCYHWNNDHGHDQDWKDENAHGHQVANKPHSGGGWSKEQHGHETGRH
ncbi:hypothetical protein BDV12DRAFT_194409 [Aspergillus spectabilis]